MDRSTWIGNTMYTVRCRAHFILVGSSYSYRSNYIAYLWNIFTSYDKGSSMPNNSNNNIPRV